MRLWYQSFSRIEAYGLECGGELLKEVRRVYGADAYPGIE